MKSIILDDFFILNHWFFMINHFFYHCIVFFIIEWKYFFLNYFFHNFLINDFFDIIEILFLGFLKIYFLGFEKLGFFLWNFRFFRKNPKKRHFWGSQKKVESLGSVYQSAFLRKTPFFSLLIAPLADYFGGPDFWPRSCFYTVPVLVVGGVQSGGDFSSFIFQTPCM
jgi:hypothetical protein